MECVHCANPIHGRVLPPRGLCWPCYRVPGLSAKYQPKKRGPKAKSRPTACPSCSRPATGYLPAGVCWTCYRDPAKRPPKPAGSPKVNRRTFEDDPPAPDDPTPEQVEVFAAWWDRETERMDAMPELPRVGRLSA